MVYTKVLVFPTKTLVLIFTFPLVGTVITPLLSVIFFIYKGFEELLSVNNSFKSNIAG